MNLDETTTIAHQLQQRSFPIPCKTKSTSRPVLLEMALALLGFELELIANSTTLEKKHFLSQLGPTLQVLPYSPDISKISPV
jgi:hypothetical protein